MMTFDEIKAAYLKKIGQDIRTSLVFIVPLIKPKRQIFKDFINHEGRFNNVNSDFNKGLINSQQKSQSLNPIRLSLIELADRLSAEDLVIDNGSSTDKNSESTLLELLRESTMKVEELKVENLALKSKNPASDQKLKIIVECEPEISDRPTNYECQCLILDEETGETREEQIQLRREPGGIIATLHEIKPTDLIQLKIRGNNQEWESDHFSSHFRPQTLVAR